MPDLHKPDVLWRLLDLRLKIAALQRAEMLVQHELTRRKASAVCEPERYAPTFRKIDETLREFEAGHGSEESIFRLSRAATCLEREACELIGDWLQPRIGV